MAVQWQLVLLLICCMPCRATLAQLADVIQARAHNLSQGTLTQLAGITTDTRTLQPADVFLALRGDKFDGHEFVAAAIAAGAIAAIVDDRSSTASSGDLPQLVVNDTLQAYQAIGQWWRNQFKGPVIAITGSVGKTTTKELIAAVLASLTSSPRSILKSQANHNNEIGVPKTLLELGPEHRYAVVEMGMRGKGEIALLSQLARPTIAVITNVGTAHIGRLGSEAAIAQAKCELLAEMPSSSVAILNHDNPLLIQTASTVWPGETLTYGLEGGDIRGHMLNSEHIAVDGVELPLPLPGRHNALNYLAAIAVAKVLGLDWSRLQQGLTVELPAGRAQRYELPGDVVILDETYNAGLESMLASLRLLSETPGQRRIAVLGTMKELGERSPEFHQQVGSTVRELGLDALLILADDAEAEAMASGAAPLPSERFSSHTAVVERLHTLIQPGDRVLFKASRAVGLDQVVNQFRATYT